MTQQVDEWGRVVFDEDGLFELIYSDVEINSDIVAELTPVVEQYNKLCDFFDQKSDIVGVATDLGDVAEYHQNRQDLWSFPSEFDINMSEFLLAKCDNEVQRSRVKSELKLYEELGATKVLQLFNYVVTTLRQNGVVWGVGRGSSVASYCLFLLGVHKIDSIKYDLDIREFLRSR